LIKYKQEAIQARNITVGNFLWHVSIAKKLRPPFHCKFIKGLKSHNRKKKDNELAQDETLKNHHNNITHGKFYHWGVMCTDITMSGCIIWTYNVNDIFDRNISFST